MHCCGVMKPCREALWGAPQEIPLDASTEPLPPPLES